MDVTQALKDAENSLRDFIATTLEKQFGNDWHLKMGMSSDRIIKWQDRKTEEAKRQVTGAVEERILYYADFYDLETILKKNWQFGFKEVFGEFKTMEVWLSEMGKLRDPDAHRRELLPHQKHLVLGISGEIRTKLIKYRSKMETSKDVFSRIESARDSLGNVFTYGQGPPKSKFTLRPGDTVDFVVTASDPLGAELEYGMTVSGHHHSPDWQKKNEFTLTITADHVRESFGVMFWIKSPRPFHAHGDYDDSVTFSYDVLPPKQ